MTTLHSHNRPSMPPPREKTNHTNKKASKNNHTPTQKQNGEHDRRKSVLLCEG